MIQEAIREAPTLEAAKKAALEALSLSEDEAVIEILEAPSKGFLGLFGRKDAKVRVTRRQTKEELSALAELEALTRAEQVQVKKEVQVTEQVILPVAEAVLEKSAEPTPQRMHDRLDKKEIESAESVQIEKTEAKPVEAQEDEDIETEEEAQAEAIIRGRAFLTDLLQAIGVRAKMTEEDRTYGHAFLLHGDRLGGLIGKHGQTLEALQYLLTLSAHHGNKGQKARLLVDVEDYRERREEALQKLAHRLADKAVRTGHIQALEPMNRHERKVIHLTLQDDNRVQTRSIGEEPFRRIIIELVDAEVKE